MTKGILKYLPIDQVEPNPEQPRRDFDQDELTILSNSILEVGVLNPIAVTGPTRYEGEREYYTLIDGERRLRAARLAGLTEIPAMVRVPKSEVSNLALAMIGNLQRADLNPIEEALSYKRLKELGWTYTRIARELGVSYGTITLRNELLTFDPQIQRLFAEKRMVASSAVCAALHLLPEYIRVRTALKLAAMNATERRIVGTCNRIAMRPGKSKSHRRSTIISKSETPSLQVSGATDSPSLKALGAAGKLPGWSVIQTAAQETCQECAIRDSASEDLCMDCAAVDLLKRIQRISQQS